MCPTTPGSMRSQAMVLPALVPLRAGGSRYSEGMVCLMSLRDDPGFEHLAETVVQLSKGERFHFFPSFGNWGDSLINDGTTAHFSAHGFEFESRPRRELPDREMSKLPPLAVVGGGGGWCQAWSSTPDFLEGVSRRYRNVVLLPTSFDLSVAGLGLANVVYFSRDRAVTEGATYCPDMAFFLTVEHTSYSMRYPLVCLRRDRERNADSVALDRNWDISLLGDSSTPSSGFVSIVSRFPLIYTDRLHVAIAGALAGRAVRLLEGNYPKARRVYEATMEGVYPDVSMMSWRQFKKEPIVRRDRRATLVRRLEAAGLSKVLAYRRAVLTREVRRG